MPANNNRWKALILRYLLSKLLGLMEMLSCLSWSQLRLFNMKSAFPMLANLESINSASPATTSFVSWYLPIFSSQVLSAIATAILKGPSISPLPFQGQWMYSRSFPKQNHWLPATVQSRCSLLHIQYIDTLLLMLYLHLVDLHGTYNHMANHFRDNHVGFGSNDSCLPLSLRPYSRLFHSS